MDWAWYSVHLETRAPEGAADVAADEDSADALMEFLEEYDGIVSSGVDSWSVTLSVQESSAAEAAHSANRLVEDLAVKAGMPPWPLVRADAVRQDILDAENARPTLPELVSAPEAAEILSVSPQRLHEIAISKPEFPEPMYELRTGKLWLRDAIEAFGCRWDRKPGRPSRSAAAS
jgi:hypothetical protein